MISPLPKAERDITLAPREFVSLSSNALLGRFFDITYAYRFGTPAHDATVARLLDPETGAIIAESTHVLARHAAAARDMGLTAKVVWNDTRPALLMSAQNASPALSRLTTKHTLPPTRGFA